MRKIDFLVTALIIIIFLLIGKVTPHKKSTQSQD